MTVPTTVSEDTVTAPATSQPQPERVVAAGLTEPSAYDAPMPTAHTVRMRTNLPVQAYRFAAVSLKMTRMILRSHG